MLNDVIICISEGKPFFPNQIPARLCYGKDYPYSRMGEVASIIKAEGLKNRYSIKNITKEFIEQIPVGQIFTLSGTNADEFFYVRKPGEKKSVVYRIVKINDNTLPWTIIKNEEGRERIQYFNAGDNYEIIDRELNYAREKEIMD